MSARETSSAHAEKSTPATTALAEAAQLVFLDAKRLYFFTHGPILRLTVADDCSYLKVSVLRAFPLSEPDRWLSVRDGTNQEIGLIVEPSELSAENRQLVEEELRRRYFVPDVSRIIAARERFGTVEWTVETDCGVRRFTTQNLRENVQRPAPGRIILTDVDGNRYDIRNLDRLNSESQELLFQHI